MRAVFEIRYDVEWSTSAFAFDSSNALSLASSDMAFNEALVELIHLGTTWIHRNGSDYEAIEDLADTHGSAQA